MKTAIIQSNYIPWLGYFNIISSVDKFVFYDTAQYTKEVGEIEIISKLQMENLC